MGIAGGKVQLTGLTLRASAGKTVTLIAHPGGTVGTAVVGSDGTFAAQVKRTSAKTLANVRYEAVLGPALTVYRQLTCSTRTVFKRIHVPRSHKLKITFPPPPSSDPVAYYQMVVKVARNGTSRPTTATLPVAVTAA